MSTEAEYPGALKSAPASPERPGPRALLHLNSAEMVLDDADLLTRHPDALLTPAFPGAGGGPKNGGIAGNNSSSSVTVSDVQHHVGNNPTLLQDQAGEGSTTGRMIFGPIEQVAQPGEHFHDYSGRKQPTYRGDMSAPMRLKEPAAQPKRRSPASASDARSPQTLYPKTPSPMTPEMIPLSSGMMEFSFDPANLDELLAQSRPVMSNHNRQSPAHLHSSVNSNAVLGAPAGTSSNANATSSSSRRIEKEFVPAFVLEKALNRCIPDLQRAVARHIEKTLTAVAQQQQIQRNLIGGGSTAAPISPTAGTTPTAAMLFGGGEDLHGSNKMSPASAIDEEELSADAVQTALRSWPDLGPIVNRYIGWEVNQHLDHLKHQERQNAFSSLLGDSSWNGSGAKGSGSLLGVGGGPAGPGGQGSPLRAGTFPRELQAMTESKNNHSSLPLLQNLPSPTRAAAGFGGILGGRSPRPPKNDTQEQHQNNGNGYANAMHEQTMFRSASPVASSFMNTGSFSSGVVGGGNINMDHSNPIPFGNPIPQGSLGMVLPHQPTPQPGLMFLGAVPEDSAENNTSSHTILSAATSSASPSNTSRTQSRGGGQPQQHEQFLQQQQQLHDVHQMNFHQGSTSSSIPGGRVDDGGLGLPSGMINLMSNLDPHDVLNLSGSGRSGGAPPILSAASTRNSNAGSGSHHSGFSSTNNSPLLNDVGAKLVNNGDRNQQYGYVGMGTAAGIVNSAGVPPPPPPDGYNFRPGSPSGGSSFVAMKFNPGARGGQPQPQGPSSPYANFNNYDSSSPEAAYLHNQSKSVSHNSSASSSRNYSAGNASASNPTSPFFPNAGPSRNSHSASNISQQNLVPNQQSAAGPGANPNPNSKKNPVLKRWSDYETAEQPENAQTKGCKHWEATGKCRLGDKCNFAHIPERRGILKNSASINGRRSSGAGGGSSTDLGAAGGGGASLPSSTKPGNSLPRGGSRPQAMPGP
eukprot:CAMPEP_0179000456 /NCGR_PEP_ID=MMETSP0795-20121207/10691_1 /TAXON_ID=88552 /ORGANISM="Amoebophrya sp., Strain Ameob2" /LENGTH=973 /DNA_ID=CAMNT_0020693473 /DNA_START=504 /DNA_END=3425 /DNA_ORIENTATION=+